MSAVNYAVHFIEKMQEVELIYGYQTAEIQSSNSCFDFDIQRINREIAVKLIGLGEEKKLGSLNSIK